MVPDQKPLSFLLSTPPSSPLFLSRLLSPRDSTTFTPPKVISFYFIHIMELVYLYFEGSHLAGTTLTFGLYVDAGVSPTGSYKLGHSLTGVPL